ncbi:hypothetical protein CEXT_487191 [Caerostris extrusa]|uniref:Uncharacterized protein n=1 Tax=Caerostris extrusa TaxID=172846 RepID=A0AAV4MFG8_CAEEX|nr:hypothetical protein CEXT_487191 [Caerostris extrusa]
MDDGGSSKKWGAYFCKAPERGPLGNRKKKTRQTSESFRRWKKQASRNDGYIYTNMNVSLLALLHQKKEKKNQTKNAQSTAHNGTQRPASTSDCKTVGVNLSRHSVLTAKDQYYLCAGGTERVEKNPCCRVGPFCVDVTKSRPFHVGLFYSPYSEGRILSCGLRLKHLLSEVLKSLNRNLSKTALVKIENSSVILLTGICRWAGRFPTLPPPSQNLMSPLIRGFRLSSSFIVREGRGSLGSDVLPRWG